MKKKIAIIILILILLTLTLTLVNISTYKAYHKNYFYMDTYIDIKLNTTKNRKEMNKIFEDIDYLYKSYHELTDRYNSYNNVINIYYLNEKLPDNEEVEIDPRLSDIINLGIEYYDKTNGLLNIAAGNLTEVWKEFINTCEKLPSNEELNKNINIKDINLENNIYKKQNNIKLDLGAIAKGYTTELVGKYLEDNNIHSYIINAGGNVKVGKAYKKEYYKVGIADPSNPSDIFIKLNINNKSVVTSGDYQRYCTMDNINYNHIINPNTKYPSNYMHSVSVVSSSSSLADIYSTYLFLLPVEEGQLIVDNTEDIEAIWYIDENNIVKSRGFNYE